MPILSGKSLVLASGSPRRCELLGYLGVKFKVITPNIDENSPIDNPELLVRHLAEEKTVVISQAHPDHVILSADTTVALAEDGKYRILGKPVDESDAVSMLQQLQGRSHLVATGFCVACDELGFREVHSVMTTVHFRPISSDEILGYVKTGEPMDKAGAYAAQGLGAAFILGVEGSYTNVIGLPLAEVCMCLERLGVWEPETMISAPLP